MSKLSKIQFRTRPRRPTQVVGNYVCRISVSCSGMNCREAEALSNFAHRVGVTRGEVISHVGRDGRRVLCGKPGPLRMPYLMIGSCEHEGDQHCVLKTDQRKGLTTIQESE